MCWGKTQPLATGSKERCWVLNCGVLRVRYVIFLVDAVLKISQRMCCASLCGGPWCCPVRCPEMEMPDPEGLAGGPWTWQPSSDETCAIFGRERQPKILDAIFACFARRNSALYKVTWPTGLWKVEIRICATRIFWTRFIGLHFWINSFRKIQKN